MAESSGKSLPSLSVRIDLDAEGRIGPGKIQLLENIQPSGSISAAGRAMDMSYKRAWDLVDEINRICRQAAVERQTGGKNGGGAVLTPFGTLAGRALPQDRARRDKRRRARNFWRCAAICARPKKTAGREETRTELISRGRTTRYAQRLPAGSD